MAHLERVIYPDSNRSIVNRQNKCLSTDIDPLETSSEVCDKNGGLGSGNVKKTRTYQGPEPQLHSQDYRRLRTGLSQAKNADTCDNVVDTCRNILNCSGGCCGQAGPGESCGNE